MSYHTQTKSLPSDTNPLLRSVRQGSLFNAKSLLAPVRYLRRFGFRMSNEYDLATSIFVSGIKELIDVRDCSCLKQDQVLNLCAYVDKTNFETEEKIYGVYGQLLELFPDTNIDVRVVELCGRSKDEVEAFIK